MSQPHSSSQLPVGDGDSQPLFSPSPSGSRRGPRKSVPPKDPNVGKDDIVAAARRWVSESFVAGGIDSVIRKSVVFDRYPSSVGASGGVSESQLGKLFVEIWGKESRRLGPRNDSHMHYAKVAWRGEERLSGPVGDPVQIHEAHQVQQVNQGQLLSNQSATSILAPDWGARLSELRSSVPTLRRVPAGARINVARALSALVDEVVESNTEEAWAKLFFFPYVALAVPSKSDKVTNLTKWVKGQVGVAADSPFPVAPRRPPPRRQVGSGVKKTDVAMKVEAKLADGDVRGAIRLLTSDDSIAPNTDATRASLLEKHPPHPQPSDFPLPPEETTPTEYALEPKEVEAAIRSFPPGSAGGLDALRPQLLKDLLTSSAGDAAASLLGSLTCLMSLVLAGKVPASFCPVFYGASLTALRKKCGGIRPVAVGNTWRRLAAKIVCTRITPALSGRFSPHQLGVGVRGGAEAGAHAARTYFTARHHTPKAFLKVDFRNAFNEIRRDNLLQAVKESLPEWYPFFDQAYRSPSALFWGTTPISSELGVQQGDPCGPALFALVLQPIVEAIRTELNLWFLDDGTAGDDPGKVIDLLHVPGASRESASKFLPSVLWGISHRAPQEVWGNSPSRCRQHVAASRWKNRLRSRHTRAIRALLSSSVRSRSPGRR